MGSRGPAPQPVEKLKIAGQYRPSKHAGRAPPAAAGKPAAATDVPQRLKKYVNAFWRLIVPELTSNGTAARLDSMAIQGAAEAWALYRLAVKDAAKDPMDKLSRCAFATYLAAWMALAAKLGLTPADRQRLRTDDDAGKPDPDSIDQFARKRGA